MGLLLEGYSYLVKWHLEETRPLRVIKIIEGNAFISGL